MKRRLKVFFTDWITEQPETCLFYRLLSERYDLRIDPQPDLLLCSVFGKRWMSFDCKKLWYTYERIPPFPSLHDYSISYESMSARNYQLPYFRVYPGYEEALRRRRIDREEWRRRKNVNYVYTNWAAKVRSAFFQRLSKDIHVDSGGKHLNNTGEPVRDKMSFIKDYKYTIAFENTSWPGYTTEKLLEAYNAGTVPIYFGDPCNTSWLNVSSVVRYEGPQSYDRVLSAIRQGCGDFEAYRAVYEQPLIEHEPEEWSDKRIGDFLEYVVDGPRHARQRGRLFLDFQYERKQAWMGMRVIDWDRRWLLHLKRFFFPAKYVKEKSKALAKHVLVRKGR